MSFSLLPIDGAAKELLFLQRKPTKPLTVKINTKPLRAKVNMKQQKLISDFDKCSRINI